MEAFTFDTQCILQCSCTYLKGKTPTGGIKIIRIKQSGYGRLSTFNEVENLV